MKFYYANEEDIKNGKTTDVYFIRTIEILRNEKVHRNVVAEITTQDNQYPWIVFTGLEEVLYLFKGKNVDIRSIPEGTVFRSRDQTGVPVPVMSIEGDYVNFAIYETPLLGFICQASGISTKAARFKKLIGNKTLLSFGVRRMHPSLAPMIDRYSYIGGCDYVSSIIGAENLGLEPRGTMPHALILVLGEDLAWKKFDEDMDPDVPRIALVDTFGDEKFSSMKAAEIVKDLNGVRLDTPSSRRGNFAHIIREVRWELDLRGYKNVSIVVSGGIKEENLKELLDAGADAFGVGTTISSASTIDYAMDIVEIDGKPMAKKGKFSGKKDVYRCENCLEYKVVPFGHGTPTCSKCGGKMVKIMDYVMKNGEVVKDLPDPKEIRKNVIDQLERVEI